MPTPAIKAGRTRLPNISRQPRALARDSVSTWMMSSSSVWTSAAGGRSRRSTSAAASCLPLSTRKRGVSGGRNDPTSITMAGTAPNGAVLGQPPWGGPGEKEHHSRREHAREPRGWWGGREFCDVDGDDLGGGPDGYAERDPEEDEEEGAVAECDGDRRQDDQHCNARQHLSPPDPVGDASCRQRADYASDEYGTRHDRLLESVQGELLGDLGQRRRDDAGVVAEEQASESRDQRDPSDREMA